MTCLKALFSIPKQYTKLKYFFYLFTPSYPSEGMLSDFYYLDTQGEADWATSTEPLTPLGQHMIARI